MTVACEPSISFKHFNEVYNLSKDLKFLFVTRTYTQFDQIMFEFIIIIADDNESRLRSLVQL